MRASGVTPGEQPLVHRFEQWIEPLAAAQPLLALPHLLLLNSAPRGMGHDVSTARYSFLSADPVELVRFDRVPLAPPSPLDALAAKLAQFRLDTIAELPPFQGGAAGVLGYDLGRTLERLPAPRCDEFGFPLLAVGLYDWVLAFDHQQRHVWLISTGYPEADPGRRHNRAVQRLRQVQRWLAMPPTDPPVQNQPRVQPAIAFPVADTPDIMSSFDSPGYLDAVRSAIGYIHAGDCFQVNLSQRLLAPATLPAFELYRRLRQRNPAPCAGFFDLGDFQIASASPERFLRVVNREVNTRPIKGTRPRGRAAVEDEALRRELLASTKDRAENVMIVDLLRNDLGRVCHIGSVQVSAVCQVESHRFVHHLVSEVCGTLRDDLGPVDLLRAAFPGGSITGAPKIRAMEIIAELEPTARGSYCGSLGYIGFDGTMDTNILIRSFTVGHGWLQFPVGGGIVADSDPQREYDETWHKAAGLLRALE